MKRILYIALIAITSFGCTKENTQLETQGNQVSLFAAMPNSSAPWEGEQITRATDVSWAADDRIGINTYNGSTLKTCNAQYFIDNAATGSMSPATEADKLYANGVPLNYYAYYPYTTGVSGDATYHVNVSDQSDLTRIDLMWASSTAQSSSKVKLDFSHQLTKLIFNIQAGQMDVKYLTGMTAVLVGAAAEADFDLKTGVFYNKITSDIPLTVTSGSLPIRATITALVVPTDDPTQCKVVFSVDGKKFQWSPSTANWQSGRSYVYNIDLGQIYAAQVGYYYYDDGTWSDELDVAKTVLGVIFDVNADGKSGKIVSLDQTKGRWGFYPFTESYEIPSIRSRDDGQTATRDMIKAHKDDVDFATDYYAFHWIYTTKNNGNINGRWYLPALNELTVLRNVWNGGPSDSPDQDANSAFNKKLTDAGGADLLKYEYYWSSTEYDYYVTWEVRFYSGSQLYDSKRISSNYIRAISTF